MVGPQCVKGCPSTQQTGNRPGIWERNHPLAPAAGRVDATGPTEYMTKWRFAGGTYDPVRLFATVTAAPQRTRAARTPRQDRGLLSTQLLVTKIWPHLHGNFTKQGQFRKVEKVWRVVLTGTPYDPNNANNNEQFLMTRKIYESRKAGSRQTLFGTGLV